VDYHRVLIPVTEEEAAEGIEQALRPTQQKGLKLSCCTVISYSFLFP
jgi:hypothetical protein